MSIRQKRNTEAVATERSPQPQGTPAGGSRITFAGVSKRFGRTAALDPIELSIEDGEFVAVIGPSGCGKSTLLNMAAGIMDPSQGVVHYRGRPVVGPNRAVGYITQKDLLLPWRTVRKNLALPLEIEKWTKPAIAARVTEVAAQVGLSEFLDHYPNQLSGGMRKRLTIGRTLAYRPETYLMDEPFGSLDAQLRTVMHREVAALHAATGSTFIFVTHDINEAIVLADRVVVLSARPGRLKAQLKIDIPRPRDPLRVLSHPLYTGYVEHLWAQLDHPADAK